MTNMSQHRGWNSGIRWHVASAALTLVIALALGVLTTQSAQAQTYNEEVLHSFTGGLDGDQPWYAGVISDEKGNVLGTTNIGGTYRKGVVFKLTPKGNKWPETVLHSFTGGADGAYPYASLIRDAKGNLYGTVWGGGDPGCGGYGCGLVFKMSSTGQETVLYTFTGGADGGGPATSLVMDAQGNLYGTTLSGGGDLSGVCSPSGCGVVFKLTPTGKKWTETVLHKFTGKDGASPWGVLTLDAKGNLYGTTNAGGDQSGYCWEEGGCGTAFKMSSDGKGFTVLHKFTGKDGWLPFGNLVLDADGKLYGTAWGGGESGCNFGCGTAFKMTSEGKGFTVLDKFTAGNGGSPTGTLVMDAEGNLYGVLQNGGADGGGAAFKMSSIGIVTILYNFGAGTDGSDPLAGLSMGAKGDLYGTTDLGGAFGHGTVFKLTP